MAIIPSTNNPTAISLGGSATSGGKNESIEVELAPTVPTYNTSGTNAISLNDPAVRTLAGVPTGQISFYCLYGKSNRVYHQICVGTPTPNWVLNSSNRPVLVPGYSAGKTDVLINVQPGMYVYSPSPGTAALTIASCTFATGDTVTLVNKGYIIGSGGAGGNGFIANLPIPCYIPLEPLTLGTPGGTAIQTYFPMTINNTCGHILGGGGGGGGTLIGGVGGGGGAGGGAGGYTQSKQPTIPCPGASGGAGGYVGSSGSPGTLSPCHPLPIGPIHYMAGGGGGGSVVPGCGAPDVRSIAPSTTAQTVPAKAGYGGGAGGSGGAWVYGAGCAVSGSGGPANNPGLYGTLYNLNTSGLGPTYWYPMGAGGGGGGYGAAGGYGITAAGFNLSPCRVVPFGTSFVGYNPANPPGPGVYESVLWYAPGGNGGSAISYPPSVTVTITCTPTSPGKIWGSVL
jgi:hypothetical protein